jgi:hypothetical protein
MNVIKTSVLTASCLFFAACGGLEAVPEELQGTWYSEAASKDCDVDKPGIDITAGSIEYIEDFDSEWRSSYSTQIKKDKGLRRETTFMEAEDKYGFTNNVLKTEKTSMKPSLELKGDALVITPFLGTATVYQKERPTCDKKYTQALRDEFEAAEAKESDRKKAAAIKAEKRKASPNCDKYVNCTCGMNDNVLKFYEKLGVDVPSSAKKATRKFCDAAKKLLDTGTAVQEKACKRALKAIGKSYKHYEVLNIDVPSSCQ